MRRIAAGLTAVAFVLSLGAPAFAKTETVKGELVDQNCYTKDKKNAGASHKECADTCAKKGQPVAIVTADGKVYQVTGGLAAENNAKLVPHMTHTVEITGDVTEKDGKMTIAADASALKMISREGAWRARSPELIPKAENTGSQPLFGGGFCIS
jgi:hypothetical protein